MGDKTDDVIQLEILCDTIKESHETVLATIKANAEKSDEQHLHVCQRLTAVETKIDERTKKGGVAGHGITGSVTLLAFIGWQWLKDKIGMD